jgi:hypothetical protein
MANGRKVRNPVFVIGAPGAGTGMLARAFNRTPGFQLTLGQRWVLPVVQAFARNPLAGPRASRGGRHRAA